MNIQDVINHQRAFLDQLKARKKPVVYTIQRQLKMIQSYCPCQNALHFASDLGRKGRPPIWI